MSKKATLKKSEKQLLPVLTILSKIKDPNTEKDYKDELITEFYNLYRNKVYDQVYDVTRRRFGKLPDFHEIAKDITQDVFLTAIYDAEFKDFDPSWTEDVAFRKIQGWLNSIGENMLRNKMRGIVREKSGKKGYRYDIVSGANRAKRK